MKVFTAAMLIAMAVSLPAAAKDRAPTGAERSAIEKKLRSLGYTSWDDIKLDDDRPYHQPKWEIDDARKGNGARFDIELEPRTLKLLQTERDD
jgi:hypothetical protein